MQRLIFTLAVWGMTPLWLSAELAVPQFFSDSMVLQRDGSAPIWGTATPGSEITVQLGSQSVTSQTDSDGKWKATLKTGSANVQGQTLSVRGDGGKIEIADVLIGEVWLASGQSNMAFKMSSTVAYKDLMAAADYPSIRMFNASTVTATEPQDDITGDWVVCSPKTVSGYSAVAFFFAKKLHDELDVPVGILKTAWGGKPVETFTSREALRTLPGTQKLVDSLIAADAAFDPDKAQAAYEKNLERWQQAVKDWKAKDADKRGRSPRKPSPPKRPLNTEGRPGVLFDSMIHPFVGYAIRGAIWYQGEANAKAGHVPYDKTLPLMINDWRSRWNDDFSFYFVQLANFRKPSTEPGTPDPWALLQDRMRLILQTTPKTGMAVINDVGAANDIHPKNKKDPGERLARWALAKDYGRDVIISGPLYQSHQVQGDKVQLKFDSVGDGLASRDGEPLQRFEIAGKDQKWFWADAELGGKDTVVVSSSDVSAPIAVRYAWASNPEGANLVNSEGLPTSVFRTDDWDDATRSVVTPAEQLRARRLALAAQVKQINERRATFKRASDEFKDLTEKRAVLMKEFRKTAGQK